MFDYPLLEVLLAVERERNFERTALNLGFSKSYISQRLRLLEERLGGVVVCRDTVTTTHFGNTLCRHLENVQLMEQEFLAENTHLFSAVHSQPVTIKVGVCDDSLASWFKTVISTLYSKSNRYFLDLVIRDSATTVQDMIDGRIHCALSSSNSPIPGFDSFYVGEHQYRATASPDFISKYLPHGVTCEALSRAPAMRSAEDETLLQNWMTDVLGAFRTAPVNVLPSVHGILNMCLDGKVWAMTSCLLSRKHLQSGALVELVPSSSLASGLHWHINKFTAHTLHGLTEAVLEAAQCLSPGKDRSAVQNAITKSAAE